MVRSKSVLPSPELIYSKIRNNTISYTIIINYTDLIFSHYKYVAFLQTIGKLFKAKTK